MLRHVTTALSGDCPYVVSQTAELGRYGAVNYRLQGSHNDPLVVCFHGLNASVAQFDGLAAFLISFNYQVLAFDLLGHGLSDGLPGKKEYTPADFVGQAIALLKALNLGHKKHHVIGFSLGGLIAALYSLEQGPSKIESVVLLGPAGLVLNRRRSFNVCLSVPMVYLTVPAVKCAWGIAASTVVSAPLYANFNSSSRKLCRHGSNNWKCACRRNLDTALKVARGMPLSNASAAFKQLFNTGIPTLIGWGSKDTVLPVKKAANVVIGLCKQCEDKSQVCYSVYADCGHQLLHEDFHTVSTDILCHLQHRRLPEKPAVNRRFFGYPQLLEDKILILPERPVIRRRASCGDLDGCQPMTPLSVEEFLENSFFSTPETTESPSPKVKNPEDDYAETSSTATGSGIMLLTSRSIVLGRKPPKPIQEKVVPPPLSALHTAVAISAKNTTIDIATTLPTLITAKDNKPIYRRSTLKEAEQEVIKGMTPLTTERRTPQYSPVAERTTLSAAHTPDLLFSHRLLLSCCHPSSD